MTTQQSGGDSIISVGLDLLEASTQAAGEIVSGVAEAAGEIAQAIPDWKRESIAEAERKQPPPRPEPQNEAPEQTKSLSM